MTFSYTYLSNEELDSQAKKLMPGVYNFEVCDATESHSKSTGNPMIVLDLKIFDNEGHTYQIRDYLVGNSGGAFKIKSFWESVGNPEKYNSQATLEVYEFRGKSGKIKTKLEKDQEGLREYPRVAYYVKCSPTKSVTEESSMQNNKNDSNNFLGDIPF